MSTSGGISPAPPGNSYIPATSLQPGLAPTGSVGENTPRSLMGGSDWTTPASSTPYIFPGPFLKAGVPVAHVGSYVSGQNVVAQTHAWFAFLDITGAVVAVSADALTVPWWAGTFTGISIPIAYTPAADIQTLCALCFTAGTIPSFRGPNAGGGSINAFSPALVGASASAPQATPPIVGAVLALPTGGNNNYPYIVAFPT